MIIRRRMSYHVVSLSSFLFPIHSSSPSLRPSPPYSLFPFVFLYFLFLSFLSSISLSVASWTSVHSGTRLTLSPLPSFQDHGKNLRCILDFGPFWNSTYPKPYCETGKLDVRFNPRFIGDDRQLFHYDDHNQLHFYNYSCTLLSNPLVPLR